jgi:leader peptidase (prepilin peptidase)/N-methyltransferase
VTIDPPWDLLAVVSGPFIGSFAGLVTWRLPAGRQVVLGSSACPACERSLTFVDMVPILSFVAFGGRCRTCRAPIPRRYPLIELGCLVIGVWAAFVFSGPMTLVTAALGWWLLTLAIIDAEHFWLPDVLTLPLAVSGVALAASTGAAALRDALIGAAVGYGALKAIAWAYRKARGREGLGGGDAKLLGACGAWVGWMGLPTVLVLACLAGLSLVLAARLRGRAIDGATALPFGTFLALGTWLTWLYGPLALN